MKKLRNYLIVILIISLILFITKPNHKAHQEKIIEKYKQENPITGQLGAGDYFAKLISFHDYYVFSIAKISVDGTPISFGIAGFVIVFGSTDLYKYKDKYKDLLPV